MARGARSDLVARDPRDAVNGTGEGSAVGGLGCVEGGGERIDGAAPWTRMCLFDRGEPQRYRVITCSGAFHGRTLATIAAGGSAKYLNPRPR